MRVGLIQTSPRLLAELMAEADLVAPRPPPRFPMTVVVAQSWLILAGLNALVLKIKKGQVYKASMMK